MEESEIIADALDRIDRQLTDSDRERALAMTAEQFANEEHFGLGAWIRNEFNLWNNEPLANAVFPERRVDCSPLRVIMIIDADELSGRLLELYHQKLSRRKQ